MLFRLSLEIILLVLKGNKKQVKIIKLFRKTGRFCFFHLVSTAVTDYIFITFILFDFKHVFLSKY